MNILKSIISIIVLLTSLSSIYAVEYVEVSSRCKGAKASKKIVKLLNLADGGKRLVIKKDSIGNDIVFLDIHPTSAIANKGDEGYFIFARGEYINFTRDD